VSGAYIAAGHSCWGILNGPATGLGLAELIVHGSSSSVDLSPFDPARLQRFLSKPFGMGAAAAGVQVAS
jgi:glycine/D-amino acid oxidase-like deaminating enzyme